MHAVRSFLLLCSMKRIFFFLVLLPFAVGMLAQNQGKSRVGSANVAHEIKPAVLDIIPSSIKFVDATGNRAIDASEDCKLIFQVMNRGAGAGYGCIARATAAGTTTDISVQDQPIGVIPINGTQTIELPIISGKHTENGRIEIVFRVDEPNGFGSSPYKISIDTRGFAAPFLQVADYTITGSSSVLERRTPFDLQVLIQNTQYGLAEDITVDIELPEGVVIMGGDEHATIKQMRAGETKSLDYTLAARMDYAENTIPIKVNIKEKYGKYAQDKLITLELNQSMSVTKLQVQSVKEEKPDEIRLASLTSEVDKNIPHNPTTNTKTFAFIMANENYRTLAPVPCALNDGEVFGKYCRETLGLPAENVHISKDMTLNEMRQMIDLLVQIATYNPQSHIIFYYAGHGAPDESSKEAFLIPIDSYQVNAAACYGLDELYNQFRALTNNRVTVFLDACFSGKNRDDSMLASARGIAIAPKKNVVQGNLVVFSAASGDQTALPYEKEGHGMFTYFLLKKLQETKGDVTYGELKAYLETLVPQQSLTVNKKVQNPTVNPAPSLGDSWQTWKLK